MTAQNDNSSALDYISVNPVFSHAEFVAARAAATGASPHTTNNLLAHHLAAGHLLRVRRGLYATVPRGVRPTAAGVDPFLLATALTDDAVVAYHAALQYHGKAYSLWTRYSYLTRHRARPLEFRGTRFLPGRSPASLRLLPDSGGGVSEERHAGGRVRVTTLERTLVDVLDAPERGGGWEEVWRSLESVEFFDLDAVVAFALRLGSALTVARVGFFLDQHREALMVDDDHLSELRAHAPGQPRYLDRRREPGKLVSPWNLVVPERVLRRVWAEAS